MLRQKGDRARGQRIKNGVMDEVDGVRGVSEKSKPGVDVKLTSPLKLDEPESGKRGSEAGEEIGAVADFSMLIGDVASPYEDHDTRDEGNRGPVNLAAVQEPCGKHSEAKDEMQG